MRHLSPSLFSIFALALPLVLLNKREARADLNVSYSTSGTFDVNSQTGSTITLQNGNLTIQVAYTGTTQTNLGIPDTTAPFGYFTVTAENSGKANLPASGTFDLTITQTVPSSGNGVFTSDVSGSIKLGTSNDLTIQFNSSSNPITLGDISYTLPSSVLLTSPPNTTGASTTTNLTANISDPPVAAPEPSSLITVAIGTAMMLGYACRRCRRTVSVR
jgi:uncharacterized protein (TIGR03437 family)